MIFAYLTLLKHSIADFKQNFARLLLSASHVTFSPTNGYLLTYLIWTTTNLNCVSSCSPKCASAPWLWLSVL